MVGHVTTHENQTLLSRLDRWLFSVESVLNLLGGVFIFLLVMLATTNILGRWLFDMPVNGYIDWVEQAMAFIAFLGIAYTMREGGHIRMDIFISRLQGRYLWFTELLSVLLIFMVTLILVYGSYLHFWRAWSIGDSSLDINLPTWPAKAVVPLALTFLAIRLLLQIWGYSRAIIRNDDYPVAVPLIESPAEAAAREAEAYESDKP